MAPMINEITQEMFDRASEEERRLWRAKSWLLPNCRVAAGYPSGPVLYEHLAGPAEQRAASVIQFGGSKNEPVKRKTKKKRAA